MKLIFLYGLPASGKLTIAEELAAITGYKVFHNHLVVDALLAVFEFGSEPFVELRERIWLDVFVEARRTGLAGLIFTFAPERMVRASFVGAAIETVRGGGGEILFVEIACPLARSGRAWMRTPEESLGRLRRSRCSKSCGSKERSILHSCQSRISRSTRVSWTLALRQPRLRASLVLGKQGM